MMRLAEVIQSCVNMRIPMAVKIWLNLTEGKGAIRSYQGWRIKEGILIC